ncbi:MAG: oppD1 [Proteobacteria bacterium]|nr:oppD1 [Pseudomonadota bacterium]
MAILEIENLDVRIPVGAGVLHAVRNISLQVEAGQTLCIVGESGCGKSMSLLAIMGLLPRTAQRQASALRFQGTELSCLNARQMEDIRGRGIGMIFQDPLTAFNPTMSIGSQLEEVHMRHMGAGRTVAREKAISLLRQVGITSPESRLAQYPHELSGGLRQRVMIAMALMCDPVLLLADEPTTALDVTIQAQVLRLLKGLQQKLSIAIVFVTHDLGVVAAVADRIAVMYAGEVVETGSVRDVFRAPQHPYTQALFGCVPDIANVTAGRLGTIPGRVPSLVTPIQGCAFRERCAKAMEACAMAAVSLKPHADGVFSRCLLSAEGINTDEELTHA